MRARLNATRRRVAAVAGGFGVAAAFAVASLATAGSSHSEGAVRPARGCAEFGAAADTAESHEVFDGRTGRLVVDTGDASYVLSADDAACRANPRAQRRLANAQLVEDENRRDQCAAFRQAIAEGRTEEKGQRVNLAAAQRFVDEECR